MAKFDSPGVPLSCLFYVFSSSPGFFIGFAQAEYRLGAIYEKGAGAPRDPLKELADACTEAGIRLCFYHSIMDWHHPDYLPRRAWDTRPTDAADYSRYIAYMKGQLKELTSGRYGKVGILWFDGEWEGTWTHEMGKDLYDYCRALDKDIIVNNRVDTGRSGMEGITREGDYRGDYGTPEQQQRWLDRQGAGDRHPLAHAT